MTVQFDQPTELTILFCCYIIMFSVNFNCIICFIVCVDCMISRNYCTILSYFKIWIFCKFHILLVCVILCVGYTFDTMILFAKCQLRTNLRLRFGMEWHWRQELDEIVCVDCIINRNYFTVLSYFKTCIFCKFLILLVCVILCAWDTFDTMILFVKMSNANKLRLRFGMVLETGIRWDSLELYFSSLIR